jgi:hypothetical protein
MPLEHLQLFAIFQANDEIRLDGLLDHHGGLQRFTSALLRFRGLTGAGEGLVDGADQGRKVDDLDDILRDVGGDDLGGQFDKRALGVHNESMIGLGGGVSFQRLRRMVNRCESDSGDVQTRWIKLRCGTGDGDGYSNTPTSSTLTRASGYAARASARGSLNFALNWRIC